MALAQGGDIKAIAFPGESALTAAPAPITTNEVERMPAWSPDGLGLGFVREAEGRRQLNVFDLTPGIQTIVNPAWTLARLRRRRRRARSRTSGAGSRSRSSPRHLR